MDPVGYGIKRGKRKAALSVHPATGTARQSATLGLQPERKRVQRHRRRPRRRHRRRQGSIDPDLPLELDGGLEGERKTFEVAAGHVKIHASRKPLLILTRDAGGMEDICARRDVRQREAAIRVNLRGMLPAHGVQRRNAWQ